MKLGLLSNIDKRSTMTSKVFNDDIFLTSFCYFSNSRPICSKSEVGFGMHGP